MTQHHDPSGSGPMAPFDQWWIGAVVGCLSTLLYVALLGGCHGTSATSSEPQKRDVIQQQITMLQGQVAELQDDVAELKGAGQ